MFQKIFIIGRLGKDPEMRFTPTGQAVTSFSVAVDNKYIDADGQKVEQTIWFRVQAWGKRGETANEFLSKGKLVFVEGRMQFDPKTGGPRIWKGSDELAHASFEINALEIKFLSPKDSTPAESSEEESMPVSDDGIPF